MCLVVCRMDYKRIIITQQIANSSGSELVLYLYSLGLRFGLALVVNLELGQG